MADEGRRVRDRWTGDLGTVVAYLGRSKAGDHRYQVSWDEPTPCQESAVAVIPSRFFEWADEKAPGVEG